MVFQLEVEGAGGPGAEWGWEGTRAGVVGDLLGTLQFGGVCCLRQACGGLRAAVHAP